MSTVATLARTGASALRRRPLAAALPVLLAVYAVTATPGRPFAPGEGRHASYDLLAQALARGQLHLTVAPDPALFELADPYQPGRNAAIRLHDASLYHGRYYLYFGVVPALLAFLPWRLAGLGALPEPAAVVVFALAAFGFSALLLRRLAHEHLEHAPAGLRLAAFLVLGLANGAPFLLRGASVYEVAIAAGLCFAAAAAWLFATASDSPGLTRLALAGLCLGLAVGSRPNLVVLAPFLVLLVRGAPRPGVRARIETVVAVLVPFAACLFLLGLYNHARFGSWTELGTTYQLIGSRPIARFDYRAVPPLLYYLFLAPPTFAAGVPPIRPYHPWPFGPRVPDGYFVDERTTGALWHAPYLLVLLLVPWIARYPPLRGDGLLRRRLGGLVGAGLALPVLTSFAFASVTQRFEADFLTFLVVPALLVWLALGSRPDWRRPCRVIGAGLLFGWSVFSVQSLSIALAGDDTGSLSPVPALERRAGPPSVSPMRRVGLPALGRTLDPDRRAVVRLRIAFPERLAAPVEPLLSWGDVDRYDVLWIRQQADGFGISLDTAAGRANEGPFVSRGAGLPSAGAIARVEAGRFHELVVDLDRADQSVRGSLDGRTVFDLSGRLVALNRNRFWPGRGPRGHDAPDLGVFSGVLIPEAMEWAGPPGLDSLPPIASGPALLDGSREDGPLGPPGRLRIVAGRPGADIFTGSEWRWLPVTFVEAVALTREIVQGTPGRVVPVLAAGDAVRADVIVVRHVTGGRVSFALVQWRGAWSVVARGPEYQLTAPVRAILDRRAGTASVEADGREMLRAEAELLPLAPSGLFVGRLPAGLELDQEVFSRRARVFGSTSSALGP